MADSVDQDSQVEQASGGLFSSGFSKIGAAMPSFSSMPWTPKSDDSASESIAQPIGTEEPQEKGGFLSGVSGGFSKLTGGLPTVSAPSFGLPWSKKDGDQPSDVPPVPEEANGSTGTGTGTGTAFLSGGFSKLTGGLPSVPSFGLPWGKKEGDVTSEEPLVTDSNGQSNTNTNTNTNGSGKSEFLSGVSGGFSKLTGGLPSVPSFGLPWGKKDGENEGDGDQTAGDQAVQGQGQGQEQGQDGNGTGLNKLSSAVTGIFGVFKTSSTSTSEEGVKSNEESTTPK